MTTLHGCPLGTLTIGHDSEDGDGRAKDSYFETRTLGPLTMVEASHAGGHSVKSASKDLTLKLVLGGGQSFKADFGAGRFEGSALPGDCVLAAAGVDTTYEVAGDVHGLAIAMPGGLVSSLAATIDPAFDGDFSRLQRSLWRDEQVRDLALMLWRAAKADPETTPAEASEMLTRLVALLVRRADPCMRAPEPALALAPHIRRRLLENIEANLDGDLSLMALAELAGLSPYHFARAFRQDIGEAPHAYVLRRRIDRARRLCLNKDLSLAEVATTTGFASQQHMTSVFSRHLGVSPGRLRRALGNTPKKDEASS